MGDDFDYPFEYGQLEARYDIQKKELTALRELRDELESEVRGWKATCDGQQERIAELEEECEKANASLSKVAPVIEDLERQLAELEADRDKWEQEAGEQHARALSFQKQQQRLVEAEVPRSVFNEAAKVIEENRMEKL